VPSVTYVSEQAVVEGLLAGWPALNFGPIQWPGQQFTRPNGSGDPANPARYLAYETDYVKAERVTFGGDEEVTGRLRFGCWVESETGEESDAAVRVMMDALHDLILGPDSAPFPQPLAGVLWVWAPVPGAAAAEGTWYGRAFEFPFNRFRQP
jgi:hypothetical protein